MKKEMRVMAPERADLVEISSEKERTIKDLGGLVDQSVFVRTPTIKMKECLVKKFNRKTMTLTLEPYNTHGPYIEKIEAKYYPSENKNHPGGKTFFVHVRREYGTVNRTNGLDMYRVLKE